VYRGIAGIDISANFPVGLPVRIWELMSTSEELEIARIFEDEGGSPTKTRLVITTPGVRQVAHFSKFPDERECLFLPGSTFVTEKIEFEGQLAIVTLRHVPEDLDVYFL
jgi:hypothetical protein